MRKIYEIRPHEDELVIYTNICTINYSSIYPDTYKEYELSYEEKFEMDKITKTQAFNNNNESSEVRASYLLEFLVKNNKRIKILTKKQLDLVKENLAVEEL